MTVAGTEKTITIRLNGRREAVPAPATVASLVRSRNPRPPFAVEVNQQLVRRPAYESAVLKAGDEVEIVTLVGGG